MEIPGYFASTATPSADRNSGPGDYSTFLNMLTVQMRNQDPLNPMASTDFAVQLATFSSVEQQMMTNQLLGGLLERSALADLGSWVGMEARIQGEGWFDGAPIALAPDPAVGAEQTFLVVRDGMGTIVDRRELPADSQSYLWEGVDSDGMPLPSGRYSFELESLVGDEVIDTAPVGVYMPILEARSDGGNVFLVLPGGLLVDSAMVAGLRQPRTTE